MNTPLISSASLASSPHKTSQFLHITTTIQTLAFCCPKFLYTPKRTQFRHFYKFPRSIFPVESQTSDADEEEDDDDEEVADEYEEISDEVSDGVEESDDEIESSLDDASEAKSRYEEFKWQRVQRLCNEVREFGEEIIDVNELSSIYNFRIDKFQVTLQIPSPYTHYVSSLCVYINSPIYIVLCAI